jgi:PGF-CTERM protein
MITPWNSAGIARARRAFVQVVACLLVASVFVGPAAAGGAGAAERLDVDRQQSNEDVCVFDAEEWREAQTVAGVELRASEQCRPDNPATVAASVAGTNNVPMDVLMRSGLARDAVRKHADRDGDGDPDVVEITLEATSVNEFDDRTDEIAPGVEPAFWVFAPKTRGMVRNGSRAERLIRMPSVPIRVEQNDTVRVTMENAHYFPHTIHFHGVDHPYRVNGSGNDGVLQVSEKPVEPGEDRTYEFRPRQPGTMFYHCHVVPNVHVTMGLNGMFVVEENRSDNRVQTFNVGAGEVRHPSKATSEAYAGEYDLQYQGVDEDLHEIPQAHDDPRRTAKAMNREYDATERSPDYFLLNGKSFPYTIRESLIAVEAGERYRLRVLNGGSETVSLHTHGHKVNVTATDGVSVPEDRQTKRDVVTLSAAQRLDLALNTTNDGVNSYGPGLWFTHDHREEAVTTDGIAPGGTVTMIAYDDYLDDGIPQTHRNLSRFFSESYYAGEKPFWAGLDEEKFGEPPANDPVDGGGSDNGTAGDDHPGTESDGHDHDHGTATDAPDPADTQSSLPEVPVEVGVLLAGGLVALGLRRGRTNLVVVLVALVVLAAFVPAVAVAHEGQTTETPHGTESDDHHGDGGHGEHNGTDDDSGGMHHGSGDMDGGMMDKQMVENGTVVNENTDTPPGECEEIRDERAITVEGGARFGEAGEMFAFSEDSWELPPCTAVTVTFVNHDHIRHQWMVHGLPADTYPMGMFNIEVNGPGSVTGTFVTPAEGGFDLHCSLPQHEQKGMHARIEITDDQASADAGDETEPADSTTTGDPGTVEGSGPGFGLVGVLVALLGLVAVARRR